jgi:hypothetical protein
MRGGRSTPTDLRPSPAKRTIPQEVTDVSIHDKGPGYYVMLSRILQMDFGEWGLDELLRILLPKLNEKWFSGGNSLL